MKKMAILMICLTICICIVFGVLYKIDVYRMDNNEPVVFSTWGREYAPSEEVSVIVGDNIESDSVYFKILENTVNSRGLNAKIINNTNNAIAYLDYYSIEKKIGDKWCYYGYECDISPSWNDMTYVIGPNDEVEIGFYWSDIYGELEGGKYRLVKEYYDNGDTSNRVHYLYGEFEL